jgi:hypothetical protein
VEQDGKGERLVKMQSDQVEWLQEEVVGAVELEVEGGPEKEVEGGPEKEVEEVEQGGPPASQLLEQVL